VLIQKLGLGRGFHLYGQSFGGLLAFEYLKRRAEAANDDAPKCRSVVLSSAPSNVDLVESVANGLLSTLLDAYDNGSEVPDTHQCNAPTAPRCVRQRRHTGIVAGIGGDTRLRCYPTLINRVTDAIVSRAAGRIRFRDGGMCGGMEGCV